MLPLSRSVGCRGAATNDQAHLPQMASEASYLRLGEALS